VVFPPHGGHHGHDVFGGHPDHHAKSVRLLRGTPCMSVFLTCYWFQLSNQLGCDVSFVSNSDKYDEDNKTKRN